MKWQVTTPPADSGTFLRTDLLKSQCWVETVDDDELLEIYRDAAVDYAEDAMECSLLPRTITAQFFEEDARNLYPQYLNPYSIGGQWDTGTYLTKLPPTWALPRGPVTAVISIVDGKGNTITNFTLEKQGNSDRLRIPVNHSLPLTVVYTAGYATAAAIPAGIKAAILAHVGTLYARRESVSEKAAIEVPHSLAAFYALKARRTVGG